MSSWAVPIIVAVIVGPVVVLLGRNDKRNTQQHARSMDVLERLDSKVDRLHHDMGVMDAKVDRLDKRLTSHIRPPRAVAARKKATK